MRSVATMVEEREEAQTGEKVDAAIDRLAKLVSARLAAARIGGFPAPCPHRPSLFRVIVNWLDRSGGRDATIVSRSDSTR